MSSNDDVFVDCPVEDVAGWLSAVLGAERVADVDLKPGSHLFTLAATSVDLELVLVISPNDYGDVDPEPEDISAIDDYPTDLDVRLVGAKDHESQPRECRLIFDRLVAARPDVAMLLVTSLSRLVAAHLPDVGTRVFEESISPDAPDVEIWRSWVRGWA